MDPFYWALLLLLLGVVLMVLEIFIPSGGLLGVLAALSIIGAVVVAFSGSMTGGATILGAAAVTVPLFLYLAVKIWPHTPIGRLIFLRLPTSDREVLPENEGGDLETLIGKVGVAKSKMLPSGLVRIEGRSYDAVSRGMAIDPGEAVKVVGVRLNRIVVAPTAETPSTAPSQAGEEVSEEDLLARPIDALGLDPLDDPLA